MPKEKELEKCIVDLLNQKGRTAEEATAWCRDYLMMGGKNNEPTSSDSANVREAERTMQSASFITERVIGKTKVSPNYQIALIKAVRPWIPAQPGQSVQYRKLKNGMVIIELSDDAKGGETHG